MTTIILVGIIAFIAGIIVGIALAEKLNSSFEAQAKEMLDFNKDGKLDVKDAQLALDLNKDGKVDAKDLNIAKTELKKTATQVTKLAKKVK
jgi:uncharacterized membrane-anchored protein YhcB (DUF1043 family)